MKKQIILTLIICVIAGFSCKKGESLSEKRAKERKSIAKYISDNEINVIKADSIPNDAVFGEKDYYLLPSGLYINIESKGTGEKPKAGDNVIFRYYTFSMENDTLARAMTAKEVPNAVEFKYGTGLYSFIDQNNFSFHSLFVLNTLNNYTYVMKGIQEAFKYLSYDGAAYLIVPSSIGSAKAQDNVQAYRYEIRHIKIY